MLHRTWLSRKAAAITIVGAHIILAAVSVILEVLSYGRDVTAIVRRSWTLLFYNYSMACLRYQFQIMSFRSQNFPKTSKFSFEVQRRQGSRDLDQILIKRNQKMMERCSDYFYVTVYDAVVVGTISHGNNRGIYLGDDDKHARENGVAGDQEVAGIYFTYWYIMYYVGISDKDNFYLYCCKIWICSFTIVRLTFFNVFHKYLVRNYQ